MRATCLSYPPSSSSMTGHSSSYSDFMDESLYTHLIQQPLGFCYLLILQNIEKYPKAPSQPVFIGSLSNPLLPLVGQKLSGLALFLEGSKKELVPTLGSCGEQASAPSLETDACYCSLPHSGIYCFVPLPWKVEPPGTEERIGFGRVCPLPWRGQDRTPFTQSLCGKNSG